ncbi:quinone-dependent dihydroorotate dehydrogenase [Paenibacillus thermoaerophilus]|uniref:Dihydroorotate dehydrogenase (quinone) n=1 Tax=Paenibacillus thermoaerophilus TaxID=1215385 RepID=A0ABW2V827_9BACL|nr:quinone-dependent dihydroorotate dehydrogenase [Paenibacillus thermoaerophilus]TMV17827.1 quinone-dependent dihydroorotate dehydrogenase [Paenibacillus thermoaerophilus]
MLYQKCLKPIFFRMDAENAHHFVIHTMKWAGAVPGGTGLLRAMWGVPRVPELEMNVAGLTFPGPVGLAAGLDKNGVAVDAFSSVGFGFVEVGTVTPQPQPGNDKPRLFRLPPDEALINRMGFNNVGADEMERNLSKLTRHRVPVGVNIGKNKWTPNERAEDDYRACIRKLHKHADFFVVNISSPNTPDLRNLQHGEELRGLLAAVTDELAKQANGGTRKPVFVKIAPDLSDAELEYMADTIAASGVSGIIATNTTLSREGLTHGNRAEAGGLSGRPLTERSTQVVRRLYRTTGGRLPIIGCGGIFTAEDAYAKIRAGASLVEIYTSLIYKGPGIAGHIQRGLLAAMRRDGFTHLSQAVGADITS